MIINTNEQIFALVVPNISQQHESNLIEDNMIINNGYIYKIKDYDETDGFSIYLYEVIILYFKSKLDNDLYICDYDIRRVLRSLRCDYEIKDHGIEYNALEDIVGKVDKRIVTLKEMEYPIGVTSNNETIIHRYRDFIKRITIKIDVDITRYIHNNLR